MRCKRPMAVRVCRIVVTAGCLVFLTNEWTTRCFAADKGAVDRILATEQAAIELSPGLAAIRAGAGAHSAEAMAGAAAGVPYVEVQQEGVGPGFDW